MGALGIMIALFARQRGTIRGQVVDLAVFEALLRLIDYHVPVLSGAGLSPMRNGLRQPMDFAPGGMFRTKDGVWVTISAGGAETARRLLRAVGGDSFAEDPRFATMEGITADMTEVFDRLNEFVTARDFAEVEAEFMRHDAVAAPVLRTDEILAHPQIAHRGDVVSVEGDATKVIGPVPHLSSTPGSVRWLGRMPGADTAAIMSELGYDSSTIEKLSDAGLISVGPAGEEVA
jgi:crotonobetainyl-CoA:carnitine CoA-transferase CaiB-like acyl-CoA transferase